jgi:hypothetical protein
MPGRVPFGRNAVIEGEVERDQRVMQDDDQRGNAAQPIEMPFPFYGNFAVSADGMVTGTCP